jgi:predicted secreted hydrolase
MRRRALLATLWPAAWSGAARAGAIAGADAGFSHALAGAIPAPSSPSALQAPVTPRPVLRFPADHASHPDTRIEWWYVTGWLRTGSGAAAAATTRPDLGFQVTFFRWRTGLAPSSPSRFAARQVLLAHLALTDLSRHGDDARLLVDQRAAREGFGLARTPVDDGAPQVVSLGDWSLTRAATPAGAPGSALSAFEIAARSRRFALTLSLRATQPVLLQGDAGFFQKGPRPDEANCYYSEPQLEVSGRVERAEEGGAPRSDEVVGRAWFDHEWSDEMMPAEAIGWDWVGANLLDGAALTVYRLRRADGSTLWAGGSFRDARGHLQVFGANELDFRPLRSWTSPRTQVRYPVEWRIATPAGQFAVVALQDDQELDSRATTGSLYWEGLSALRSEDGRTLGWGYLELTGYAGRQKV